MYHMSRCMKSLMISVDVDLNNMLCKSKWREPKEPLSQPCENMSLWHPLTLTSIYLNRIKLFYPLLLKSSNCPLLLKSSNSWRHSNLFFTEFWVIIILLVTRIYDTLADTLDDSHMGSSLLSYLTLRCITGTSGMINVISQIIWQTIVC